jgi:hypothetical protein
VNYETNDWMTAELNKGLNSFYLDISNFVSGIYIYNISINGISFNTGKMNIVK